MLDLLLSLFEHTYGKLHCQNNSGPLKKITGFLEVSRKTFPSICKEYMVTHKSDWVGRSEPAWQRKLQPWICVSCVKVTWAVSEVMKYIDICTKPWFCWRHGRFLMNVSERKISCGFFPLLPSTPDPYWQSHFLSKYLILWVVKQLLGRADLASLPNKKKGNWKHSALYGS